MTPSYVLPADDPPTGFLFPDEDLLELADQVDQSRECAKGPGATPLDVTVYLMGCRAISNANAIRRLHGLPDSIELRRKRKEGAT